MQEQVRITVIDKFKKQFLRYLDSLSQSDGLYLQMESRLDSAELSQERMDN